MGKDLKNEVEYYYDSHPTLEDLMGETSIHAELVRYLILVLTWLFRGQQCAIYKNLNFYQTRNPHEYPLAPDIAVIKGVAPQHLRSWKVGLTGPAPQVVFEIASEETWKNDLQEKPFKYATMGVKEYFFYDPGDSPYWRRTKRRLIGWQLDQTTGTAIEMVPDQQGRLWSQQLESFLVPDDMYLRLYDSNNQRRLTEAQALAQENEALAREKEALIQKLRSLGVNPDEI
jgi:Uma2 family endonuclease